MSITSADRSRSGHRLRIPSYAVLVGLIYGICVLGMSLSIGAEMVFGYTGSGEQPRSLAAQLAGVLGFGTAGLLISAVAVRTLRSDRQRAVGAVVFGILTIPALAFFWCGMPAFMGATAAALAGLTRGGSPQAGTPRLFGLLGLVFAILNPIVNALGVTISWIVTS